jgi:hypothetical protein
MKAEHQQIAIALADGWIRNRQESWQDTERFSHKSNPTITCTINGLPKYLNDLNAMHEVEGHYFGTDEIAWSAYNTQLFVLLEPHRHYLHATAAQRAEAFLRTINKWEES